MEAQTYLSDWLTIIPENYFKTYNKMLLEAQLNGIPIEPKDGFGVFKAFNRTPLHECKAVILGQDPYPQEGVSTGLAFGNDIVQDAPEIMSPSLKVIRESVLSLAKFMEFPTFDPSLESWAAQGILLLNSALTVRRNTPGSHTAAWRPFVQKVVQALSNYNPDIMWLMFGKQAWGFEEFLNPKSPRILEYHPAYYARNGLDMNGVIWEKLIQYYKDKFNTDLHLYE